MVVRNGWSLYVGITSTQHKGFPTSYVLAVALTHFRFFGLRKQIMVR